MLITRLSILLVSILCFQECNSSRFNLTYARRISLNSSCGMSCGLLLEIGPPPDMMLTIPPPPLPSSYDSAKIDEFDDKCNFCNWASSKSNEFSDIYYFTNLGIPKKAGGHDAKWIWISIIIYAIYVVLGLSLIIGILHCNNIKVFPGSQICPILSRSKSAKKPDPKTEIQISPQLVRLQEVKPLVHLWRQGSSQEKPLQTPSSQCSEANSYSGEPYMCDTLDSQPVYSEINIRSETSSTIYSEVADPPPPVPPIGPMWKLLADGSYENEGFFTSEGQPRPTFHSAANFTGSLRSPKTRRLRSEGPSPHQSRVDEALIRQESPYYYKQTDQLPARKPLPLLPSQRIRSLPRRPLPNTPPAPEIV